MMLSMSKPVKITRRDPPPPPHLEILHDGMEYGSNCFLTEGEAGKTRVGKEQVAIFVCLKGFH